MAPRNAEAGFTLVEMLVALAVFAVIAASGVGLLRASVDTQWAVEDRLADMGRLGRLHALLAGDIGQAVARPVVDEQADAPQFAGTATRMAFTRAGWTNLDDAPRSELQQVEWSFEGGRLVRSGRAQSALEPGARASFANELQSGSLRYRRADGSWSPAFASTPLESLPAAVEVTLARRGEQPVTLLFAVGPAGAAPQPRVPQ